MRTAKSLRSGQFINRQALILLALCIVVVGTAMQSPSLVIDGSFNDWFGQPFLPDPSGDGPTPNTDIVGFYWGTNPGEEYIYWMVERAPTSSGNPRVYYYVFIDCNNNNTTNDDVDRKIQVFYDPQSNSSQVTVRVMRGTGSVINQYSGDWGDPSSQGGRRAEWRVSFADLGIDAHQPLHMSAGASQSGSETNIDRMPNAGDITWTPIPVLGWVGLAGLTTVVIAYTWLRFGKKIWRTT